MWVANQKRQNKLKPLKLVPIPVVIEPTPSLESISTTVVDVLSGPTNPTNNWKKDLKLTRIANRERKKLSTITTSSGTSDSQSVSRVPLTPPDLPELDGRLRMLEEKFEAVENMVFARQRLFENLGKESGNLNLELLRQLSSGSLSKKGSTSSLNFQQTPTTTITTNRFTTSSDFSANTPTDQLDLKSDDSDQQHPVALLHETCDKADTPSNTEEVTQSEPQPAAGWGGYFKKLW